MKIYVIGSLTQHREIRLIASTLNTIDGNDVRFVKRHDELSLDTCIKMCYENIEWCDVVYILRKENGVTYEKVYAEKCHKEIIFIS